MKKLISLVLSLVVCALLTACNVGASTKALTPVEQAKAKLAEAYSTCCCGSDTTYASLASDNMALILDTKPNDSNYSGEADAIDAIQSINSYLEFSTSLWEKMSLTRALDGMQTQSSEDYTVTWTYHPNNGLRVIYEVNP